MIHSAYAYEARRVTWAMDPMALESFLEVPPDTLVARRKLPQVKGRIAILPIHGMISQRSSIWQDLFGGTATDSLAAAYTAAVNDDRVGAVLFDIDSPGGTVPGVPDTADLIYEGSRIKETAASVNGIAASAAYWLGSQVGFGQKRFAAAPGSDVGSIGAFRIHEDVSGMLENEGIKISLLAIPPEKVEANPFEPLSDEAREHNLSQVQTSYNMFVDAVARGRGVSRGTVQESYGKGRVFESQQAADMGLVDRVGTFSGLLGEMAGGGDLTSADAQDLTDTLCHAWECGVPTQMVDRKTEQFARIRRAMRLS